MPWKEVCRHISCNYLKKLCILAVYTNCKVSLFFVPSNFYNNLCYENEHGFLELVKLITFWIAIHREIQKIFFQMFPLCNEIQDKVLDPRGLVWFGLRRYGIIDFGTMWLFPDKNLVLFSTDHVLSMIDFHNPVKCWYEILILKI